MKVFLQRHEVRTQGDMKKEGMPQNGCPDLKKKKPILFNYTGFPKIEPGAS